MYATHHTPARALATMRERVARATGELGLTENLGGGCMGALYWTDGAHTVVVLTDEGVAEYDGDQWETGDAVEPQRACDAGPYAIVAAATAWITQPR